MLDLASKILFNEKIKQTIVFYSMNLFKVLYHCKDWRKIIEKTIANWENQFETKTKQSVSVIVEVVVSI